MLQVKSQWDVTDMTLVVQLLDKYQKSAESCFKANKNINSC